ncbi:hypothetical protein OS493_019060 [Desmophyllum pertusum]|uniref:Ig-like domain-containing protein n=1 Tax=Desmophyllum pertusum TaxID=174260 RepID=A0A9X0CRA1_9CNID|nr:hypothetical protein OS493_019060 [Desmophyllum pertusum]
MECHFVFALRAVVLCQMSVMCGFGPKRSSNSNPNGSKWSSRQKLHPLNMQSNGTPKPTITWYKNGVILNNRARAYKYPLPDGELLRLGRLLKSRHEGDYECKASNAAGSATSQTVSLTIYKAGSTPSGFPRIAKHPGFALITSGEDGTFECVATGTPPPVISWLKENKPIDLSDPRITIPTPGTVKITNVQAADEGLYECVATNSLGMVHSRLARLLHKVSFQKPVITSPPQPVTVDPETVVYLNCSATGFPKPSIVWELDGVRLAGEVLMACLPYKIYRSLGTTLA